MCCVPLPLYLIFALACLGRSKCGTSIKHWLIASDPLKLHLCIDTGEYPRLRSFSLKSSGWAYGLFFSTIEPIHLLLAFKNNSKFLVHWRYSFWLFSTYWHVYLHIRIFVCVYIHVCACVPMILYVVWGWRESRSMCSIHHLKPPSQIYIFHCDEKHMTKCIILTISNCAVQ